MGKSEIIFIYFSEYSILIKYLTKAKNDSNNVVFMQTAHLLIIGFCWIYLFSVTVQKLVYIAYILYRTSFIDKEYHNINEKKWSIRGNESYFFIQGLLDHIKCNRKQYETQIIMILKHKSFHNVTKSLRCILLKEILSTSFKISIFSYPRFICDNFHQDTIN